jgi:hypothetical protein
MLDEGRPHSNTYAAASCAADPPIRREFTVAALRLAPGASRAACYAFKGAAGPGRIDPTPIGPTHSSFLRSA